MPRVTVREDQFEVSGDQVVHLPTRAKWTAYPGQREPHIKNLGRLGGVLPNGDDFRVDEVERVALKLLAEREME